jgi:chemotaxis protein methyltransferase CheR
VKGSLGQAAELVRRETGITVPAAREAALRAAVHRAAAGLDPDVFLSAAAAEAGRDLLDRLIDEVTVRETAFLRDRGQFDAIDWYHLLKAAEAAGQGTIRLWSVGCASGEEAYTLALLAAEAFAPAPPPVDVLGTDISGAALSAATAGHYGERAVRALSTGQRLRYLNRPDDGGFLVGEGLRRLVRFRRHNLARDPIPPQGEAGFDVIACRNVLIYFDQPLARRVIEALEGALRRDGRLMLGAADALQRTAHHRTQRPRIPISRPAQRTREGAQPTTRPPGAPAGGRDRHQGPGAGPPLPREQRLSAALTAADGADRTGAMAHVAALLDADPLDADAHFIDGLVTLEAGDPGRAAAALRRALFIDGAFALAAFTLGRAYDVLGDANAARQAYARALRTLDPDDHRHEQMLQQVDIGDIAAACRARLADRP